jgi:hypothetical protein
MSSPPPITPPEAPPAFTHGDPSWLAHRIDRAADAVRFHHVPRGRHGQIPFLTDDYVADAPMVAQPMAAVQAARGEMVPAPLHFIFHSAFCASTLLCRALDAPGLAMGLSEPVMLNDIVGFRRRGEVDARGAGQMFDSALSLLARPWGAGEAVVVKPSNILNPVAAGLLTLRPDARAIVMTAPLPVFLASVARKGMWCRLWVRELLEGMVADGAVQLGFDGPALFRLTDLQVAAVGWLAQQQIFHGLIERFGGARVRSLSSEALMAAPVPVLAGVLAHFGLDGGNRDLDALATRLAAGPAFTRNSKDGAAFSATDRAQDQARAMAAHGEEIDKVLVWAAAVAANAGVAMELGAAVAG